MLVIASSDGRSSTDDEACCARRPYAARKRINALQCCRDGIPELSAEALKRVLIVVHGGAELVAGGRMELVNHRRRRRSISAKTSRAGTPRTRPASRSLARTANSSSQASSTPFSVGSRLAMSKPARRARSAEGSSRSCLASASALRSTTITLRRRRPQSIARPSGEHWHRSNASLATDAQHAANFDARDSRFDGIHVLEQYLEICATRFQNHDAEGVRHFVS